MAYETGVRNTIDPLAGSYFVEHLTSRLEEQALQYFDEIEAEGGVLEAIDKGYFQRRIADSAYRYQMEIEKGERAVVGVNRFPNEGERLDIELLRIEPYVEREQVARVQELRRERNQAAVEVAGAELRRRAEGTDNLMPAILDCVRAHMTLGEIVSVMKEVFGEYRERPLF